MKLKVYLFCKKLLLHALTYFELINLEKKKNQVNTIVFNAKMIARNIYANFFPIKAVSGSSFTLIFVFEDS